MQATEGQTEGDTESEAGSRLWAVSPEPDVELELINREIMTRAEVGHLTDRATQAPLFLFLSRFHAQCGAWTHSLEIKSFTLYGLSQLGAPNLLRILKQNLWRKDPYLAFFSPFSQTPHCSLPEATKRLVWYYSFLCRFLKSVSIRNLDISIII